jgi:hypothetical protein
VQLPHQEVRHEVISAEVHAMNAAGQDPNPGCVEFKLSGEKRMATNLGSPSRALRYAM